jgi:hypothetical protein
MTNLAREACEVFYSPQENLAVGVSETRTCPTPGRDMSGLTVDFCGKIDFDVLYFTNSRSASSLIVRNSYDSNKL